MMQENDTLALRERLAVLERQYGRMRRLAVLALVASAAVAGWLVLGTCNLASAHAGEKPKEPVVIQAQQFLLVDGAGNAKASLFVGEDGGAVLTLRDDGGEIRAQLGVLKRRAVPGTIGRVKPGLDFYDAKGRPIWSAP